MKWKTKQQMEEFVSNLALSVQNVSMMFNLSKDKILSLKEYAIKALKKQLFYEKFWALKNVSFAVEKGEMFGVMGLNGAGKSTLLKIIAGVYKPTKGSVNVNGELVPLLELGTGFDYEFSARDNVYMNGAMYGRSTKSMAAIYDEIMDFAELWEFEHVALKNFSTGMVARLGFSVATSVQPEVLIVDEVLGVGDYKFQAKCEDRINSMINHGATVLLVTHDSRKIKDLCSRAILLRKGEVACVGDADEICRVYKEGE